MDVLNVSCRWPRPLGAECCDDGFGELCFGQARLQGPATEAFVGVVNIYVLGLRQRPDRHLDAQVLAQCPRGLPRLFTGSEGQVGVGYRTGRPCVEKASDARVVTVERLGEAAERFTLPVTTRSTTIGMLSVLAIDTRCRSTHEQSAPVLVQGISVVDVGPHLLGSDGLDARPTPQVLKPVECGNLFRGSH